MSSRNDKKLLDQVREVMRLKHYSIHTERSYCDWIKRYVLFHRMNSRDDLAGGEKKIEQFLTHLAIEKNIAPATQNQAMNALVFLYKKIGVRVFRCLTIHVSELNADPASLINLASDSRYRVCPQVSLLPRRCSFEQVGLGLDCPHPLGNINQFRSLVLTSRVFRFISAR